MGALGGVEQGPAVFAAFVFSATESHVRKSRTQFERLNGRSERGVQAACDLFYKVQNAIKVARVIRVGDMIHAGFRCKIGKALDRRVTTRRTQTLNLCDIGVVHRDDQVELREIASMELTRAEVGYVQATRFGRALHWRIGCFSNMPIPCARTIGLNFGGKAAEYALGGGGTADIAQAYKQDSGGHRGLLRAKIHKLPSFVKNCVADVCETQC